MPKIKTMEEGISCDHDNCCCRHSHHSPFKRLIKVTAFVVVILFSMLIGIAVGIKGDRFQTVAGNKIMKFSAQGVPGNMMYIKSQGVAPGEMMKFDSNTTRVAGTITEIDGNRITLTDNGNVSQTIYTTAGTIISSKDGEVPLSSLKAKQFIVSFVSTLDGTVTAQRIEIQ